MNIDINQVILFVECLIFSGFCFVVNSKLASKDLVNAIFKILVFMLGMLALFMALTELIKAYLS